MKKFLFSLLSPSKSPLLPLLIGWAYFIIVSKDITGDIGRISQVVFSKEYHLQSKFQDNLPTASVDYCGVNDLKYNTIVFLGDSFTFMIDYYTNSKSDYPDYLANIIQKKSAKFYAADISAEATFVALCNSNVLDSCVVVLESAEKAFINRLYNLDFSSSFIPQAAKWPWPNYGKGTDFFTFYKNRLIDNHTVLNVSLCDSLFTCPRKETELFFLQDDLLFPNEEQIQIAISKLESIFPADKYDVYQDFVIDNNYPKKNVLNGFYRFESNPCFVNTRPLLYKKANEGVTDLYYADDSHWSTIGAKIVAEEIAKRMDSLGIFQN